MSPAINSRRTRSFSLVAVIILSCGALLVRPAVGQHEHEHPAGDVGKLGKVNFPVSCDPSVQTQFNSAVAMLHSFWYEKANETFAQIAHDDPACAMPYWGIAMTYYHEIWSAPRAADLKAGSAAVEKAKSIGAKTQREQDYIAAIDTFYKDSDKLDHRTRVLRYEKAMDDLQARYADDPEARIFYALTLLATSLNTSPADKTYAREKKAGQILERIFVEQPEHPGVAHYIIHAYDYPPLAERALDASRRYAKIAPDSPHALHMPSHIFTRLGLWQESIDSNLASATSAVKNHSPGNELHAKDYLIYAYLQRAQDREAKQALQDPPAGRADDPQYMNWLYATGTSPARYAIERHQWAEAAKLPVAANTFPRERYSWTEANLHFARVLGAAHIGDVESARKDLAEIRKILAQEDNKYWGDQIDIQIEVGSAWITLADGKQEQALQEMRFAADHEDKTDKHNVTPGVIAPARELLGEMLLGMKQPAEALIQFEAVLRTAPNRFNALAGAGRAAKLSGSDEKAKTYYQIMLAMCEQADGDRPELREAKTLLTVK